MAQSQASVASARAAVASGSAVHVVADWLLWMSLPLACHFCFSWIGFNPTDEGWLPAIARRLLQGEVPHRDFISVRPVLSAVIEIPLVLFAGDHLLWWCRALGWFEIAVIAGVWSRLLIPSTVPAATRWAIYAAAVFLTAHTFRVMAWHSLDGLVFVSIASWIWLHGSPRTRGWAFAVAGLAVLCRQNFVFFLPVLLLCAGRKAFGRHLLLAGAAPLFYGLSLFATGAGPECLRQLAAPGGHLAHVALGRFLTCRPAICGFAFALAAGWGLLRMPATRARTLLGAGLLLTLAALLGKSLIEPGQFHHQISFFLLGVACALSAVAAIQRVDTASTPARLLALAATWTTAISIGYNSPALGGGILFLVVVNLLLALTGPWPSPVALAGAAGGGILLAIAFAFASLHQSYLDLPAGQLVAEVGSVLSGASGLWTNANTHAALAELQKIQVGLARGGRHYAILTDYSAVWMRSTERNPVPIEWAQATELGNDPRLLARVLGALTTLPPDTVIVVQRTVTSELRNGRIPVATASRYYGYYELQNRFTATAPLLARGEWFDLYAPRTREGRVPPQRN